MIKFDKSFSMGFLFNQSRTYQDNPCGVYSDLSSLFESNVIQNSVTYIKQSTPSKDDITIEMKMNRKFSAAYFTMSWTTPAIKTKSPPMYLNFTSLPSIHQSVTCMPTQLYVSRLLASMLTFIIIPFQSSSSVLWLLPSLATQTFF